MKMYKTILSSTLKILEGLPFPVPQKGRLAGITRQYMAPPSDMFMNDNYHFPMGTAYLKLGIRGVAQKAAAVAKTKTDENDVALLSGIAEVYEHVGAYINRYACAVEQQAEGDKRLQKIARNLFVLASQPPRTFEQALQLTYLMWKLRCLNKPGADIGRLDVHLYPWFCRDIEEGKTTEEEALELLCDFWQLLNENDSGDTLINVMVGGKNQDGTDAGSRLSVLMLEATKRCKQSEPHINVRVHSGLRPDIYRAMLEVQLMGQGQATVYNDEVIIPSLIQFGIPEKLAYSYTNDGCTEIMLDGYSGIDFAHIDAVAAFELAFNNGDWAVRTYRKPVSYFHKDSAVGYYTPDCASGFASGRVEDCGSFEEFYGMFLRQYAFQVRNKCTMLRRIEDDRRMGAYTSLLLNGTYNYILDSGLDILRGGFPFAAYMMFAGSIPTVADCLIAIKRLVFEKKLYSVHQIKEAIRVNFDGYEAMRCQMAACPKFGNDIDEVDKLAADIAHHFCEWLNDYRNETGFAILPALLGWRFLEEAYGTAATPDGRHYADPIAEHYCATPGKAVNGPTALINSIAKAKETIKKAAGVCAVHVTLPRNLGNSTEESLAVLDGLVKAAIENGLNQMNIAIYDKALLQKAQQDPENHRDIIVRVWGYSARFVDLCKEMQDHVISRVAGSV